MGVSKICRYGGHVLRGVRRPPGMRSAWGQARNVPSGTIYSVLQHGSSSHIIGS